ncbi:transposase [Streptomyces sp. NPDC087901]|uniref:transposase n=1 Tax=Streptomyces sp. NPDC087901 TaxID=3365818 RepID=UPI00382CD620
MSRTSPSEPKPKPEQPHTQSHLSVPPTPVHRAVIEIQALGKVGNCQIGVSVHAASDTASCPLSWRLFLPGSWDQPEGADRRARCRIPEEEHHRPKWQLALDMLDELATVGLRPAVLVADTGYGANADFRHGLEESLQPRPPDLRNI